MELFIFKHIYKSTDCFPQSCITLLSRSITRLQDVI